MVLLGSLRLIPVLDKRRRRGPTRFERRRTHSARTLTYAVGIFAVTLRFTKRPSSYVGQNGLDARAHCAACLGIVQATKHCVRVTVAIAPRHRLLICSGGFRCGARARVTPPSGLVVDRNGHECP